MKINEQYPLQELTDNIKPLDADISEWINKNFCELINKNHEDRRTSTEP